MHASRLSIADRDEQAARLVWCAAYGAAVAHQLHEATMRAGRNVVDWLASDPRALAGIDDHATAVADAAIEALANGSA